MGAYHKIIGKGVIPKKYFKSFLPENPIILEAGAHKGSDTVELAKICRKARYMRLNRSHNSIRN